MPRISQFFGVTIVMYFNDHAPPHFHARYGDHESAIAIDTLGPLWGDLPQRALALVLEWAVQHREELSADWERARQGLPLAPIAPLT
ncbi:MAG: DUF4160 domain-containing protein [Gemmatimonadota bacterium]